MANPKAAKPKEVDVNVDDRGYIYVTIGSKSFKKNARKAVKSDDKTEVVSAEVNFALQVAKANTANKDEDRHPCRPSGCGDAWH